jgi:hypothetical protein
VLLDHFAVAGDGVQIAGVALIRHGDQTVFSGAYGWASRR